MKILKELEINLDIFDKSIEFYNDKEIFGILENLVYFEPKEKIILKKETILKMIEFYQEIYINVIEEYKHEEKFPHSVLALIEDRFFEEYKIEVSDFFYFANIFNKENRMNRDFIENLENIRSLRSSLFK